MKLLFSTFIIVLFAGAALFAQDAGSEPAQGDSTRWYIYPRASGNPPTSWSSNPLTASGWIPVGIDPCTWAPAVSTSSDRLLGSTFTSAMGLATAYFYTTFYLDSITHIKGLQLKFNADDTAVFWINGNKVATGGNYGRTVLYRGISKACLVKGKNIVAVRLTNLYPGCFFIQAELSDSVTRKVLVKTTSKASYFPTTSLGNVEDEINGSYLGQNFPNPFSTSTEIKYRVPKGTQTVAIRIHDMMGKEIRLFILPTDNTGKITLETADIVPGIYRYSLIADGNRLDTKNMIIIQK